MAPDPYRSSKGELDHVEYDRIAFERDRERSRRGEERVNRYEEDEVSYTNRRGAPLRPRESSPHIDWPTGRGRTFEDERVVHERDRVTMREPSPPRLVRRQSSLDTFDRQPGRRFYDHVEETRERAPVRLVDMQPPPRRRRRDSSVERERKFTARFSDVHIDAGGRYRGDREREHVHEAELIKTSGRRRHSRGRSSSSSSSSRSRSRSRSSSAGSLSSGGVALKISHSEYPKKGKTRMPARLVSERALADLGYQFIREGKTIVVQVALGQDNIDEVLRLSQNYKKNETELVESKTTKVTMTKTGGGRGGDVFEEERRREDVYMTPAVYPPPPMAPPSPTIYAPPPGPPPSYLYQNQAPPPPPPQPQPQPQPTEYTTTVKIRDISPTRTYTTTSGSTATSMALMQPTRALAPVVIDAGGPSEYSSYSAYSDDYSSAGPATLVVDRRHHRHRSHSHSHSHSRSHSRGDSGALYAHVHDGYHHHHHHHHHHGDRELVRTERLSTGELVVYEDEVERIEEPRHGVRLEKDRKGRMALSVPRYR